LGTFQTQIIVTYVFREIRRGDDGGDFWPYFVRPEFYPMAINTGNNYGCKFSKLGRNLQ
jgi:hypothetical protein